MSGLDQLGIKYGTDKSSLVHNYLATYEFFLAPWRKQKITFLEIGGFEGASLKMWEEYFPLASVVCIDINPNVKAYENGRITVEIGDATAPEFIRYIYAKYPSFDVVLDDGSHIWTHQRITFENFFPLVAPGGYYIVEDLHSSFLPGFNGTDPVPFIEYLKNRIDYNNKLGESQQIHEQMANPHILNIERLIHFMCFMSRSCIIKKK